MNKKLFVITILFASFFVACKKDKETEPTKVYEGISLEEFVANNYPGRTPIDDSGVYLIIESEGVGELPAEGDILYCYYKGSFLDGVPFDTLRQRPKDEDLPDVTGKSLYEFAFQVSDSLFKHVPGWYKGFSQLKRGSKAVFLLPAEQAYGETGKSPILPNTPLRFDVELINARE